jgi:beta-glucosidase
MDDMGISADEVKNSGSVLGVTGAEEVLKIQKEHLEHHRLGIPLLFMADVVHGYKTIFPIPLAIGCSWDMELAQESAAVAAREAAVSGTHVTFAPMVDLVRDPRWGRVLETTGEDSYLNGEFAKAFVRGFQGEDLTNDFTKVAACVKHFAAYGAAEGGRDYNTVDMSERRLREEYLPAYKVALDVGCEMVMTSFNLVDGVPASGNKWLMRHILRDEMGFNGVLISDWGAVKEAISHGTAEDERGAAYQAINAGVDIEMMTPCYLNSLKDLINDGEVDVSLVDEAVLRILKLKAKLGLFDHPYRAANVEAEQEVVLSADHREVARQLAEGSTVLLKNEGDLLPLAIDQRVTLKGPFADNGDILGAWSWKGSQEDAVTLIAGFKNKGAQLVDNADTVVLALGEPTLWSGEARCRADIKLPAEQLQLLAKMKQMGKKVIVVLFNGRPLDLHGVLDVADAVIEAWYPGTEGGNALANLIFGDVNPSGKLSMTFPYSVGQVPIYYNHLNTGRPNIDGASNEYVSKYLDIPNEPLIPFGFGLSYTTFAYDRLQLSQSEITTDDTLTVSVNVTNTGNRAGKEIVQLYVRDLVAEVSRPLKALKGYEKIALEAFESKLVTFEITEADLRYHHTDLSFVSDPGVFEVFVGTSSVDGLVERFMLKK